MRKISILPLVLLAFALSCPIFAQDKESMLTRRPFLFKDGRAEVAAARARGESDVLLIIASMPGANEQVARLITEIEGTIQFKDDDVDYLRARVPIDRIEQIARYSGVYSLDISKPRFVRRENGSDDSVDSNPDSGILPFDTTDTEQEEWPPVLSDYPLRNRYNPLADIGAEEFLKANPTFDGRGVTIAMIDLNLDPLLPELQVAKTLDGKSTPKIVAYETALDIEEGDDGRWMRMTDMVAATNSQLTYKDRTYTAPHEGIFRIAILDESKFDLLSQARIDKDLNRDGNPPGSSRLFAVLWDEGKNDVWVDTDQDGSFADEKALTDYSVRPEFGVFGRDDPKTKVRESIAFGIQINRKKKLVALNVGMDWHASLVIGAGVASRGTAGRFDGVAPGAQLANISEGGAAYGQTEAVIRAFKNPLVDVIFLEYWSGITRSYLLRDGRPVVTEIYTRLIEKYKKPLIVPTHNYPILCGIGDLVLARGAIGVGGHEGRDNFFTNHGVRVEHRDNMLVGGGPSGYGPMGNGALKPDVIAPSNYVSTSRGFEEGGRTSFIPGLFQLPPGYAIAGGASTATPTVAGAVALLISAAKQTGVNYDAFTIKHAVTMSARYIQHLPAYKQGNGVINVAGAWEILKELDKKREKITITSRAPIRHEYSHLLAKPHEGVGLYERNGWKAGDRRERTIIITRSSGPKEPMDFAVNWTGDNGVFSAPLSFKLPLNEPTSMTISIAPDKPGAHTALLTLDHPDIPGHGYRMLVTIVAAEQFTAKNKFTIEKKTEIPRPGMCSFFYNVPEGVNALRIDLDAPKRKVKLAAIRPDTRTATGTRLVAIKKGRMGRRSGADGGEKSTFVVSDPMPGVWEIRLTDVEDTRTFDWQQAVKPEPVPPTPVTLTVSALATEMTALDAGDNLATSAAATGSAAYELSITNRMATFTGNVVSAPVGSARRLRPQIYEKEQQEFDVEVLPGSTALVVRVSNPEDPGADIDVYVFDCTGERAQATAAGGNPAGNESVIVQNPEAGKWKIVVDAATVPSGSTNYEYLEVVFNPMYGTVSIADLPQERSIDKRWIAKAYVWIPATVIVPGREPYAGLFVQGQAKDAGPFLVSLQELEASLVSETSPNKNK